ncbi:hypothetical protein CEXT_764661 [Caerostris extrusa]|uniref:Uncharacterized protein n=1 Tax=Caerostris extrusa TaxID=172846 RepID=A0AAV4N380_CAEEX|nr:hypothetical protein CEXT_764661 [Caerostris extrusa]
MVKYGNRDPQKLMASYSKQWALCLQPIFIAMGKAGLCIMNVKSVNLKVKVDFDKMAFHQYHINVIIICSTSSVDDDHHHSTCDKNAIMFLGFQCKLLQSRNMRPCLTFHIILGLVQKEKCSLANRLERYLLRFLNWESSTTYLPTYMQ